MERSYIPLIAPIKGTEKYVSTRSSLVSLLAGLHSTGIQREIDLPQIVVIGSQSVGKSSLIESISQITLPRDRGTCTRCPIECRLQNAPQWSCEIYLRYHVGRDNLPLNEVKEVAFGSTLFDPVNVQEQLRRAQRAILRPELDIDNFLNDEDLRISGKSLSFSHNCVCLRVAGPNIPDLYFYDLPGLIASVKEGGDPRDVALVTELAKTYIRKPNCLVLLVISCETDYENQGAGGIVLHDPMLKSRTIGVLTKPDLIENGTADRWLSLIRGQQNKLTHGWFCVKQSTPEQLKGGISWQEARTNEMEFFRANEPWNSVPEIRSRLGSESLTEFLSRLLSDVIHEKLPEIRRQVTARLRDVNEELDSMPIPNIKDPVHYVLSLVAAFSRNVAAEVRGIPEDEDEHHLVQSLQKVYEAFQASIRRTAPRFRPWNRGTKLVWDDMKLRNTLDEDMYGTGRIYHLDEVTALAKKGRTRELPGNYPFEVKRRMIATSTDQWGSPLRQCFSDAEETMSESLLGADGLVHATFEQHSHNGLESRIRDLVHELLIRLHRETLDKLDNLLGVEDLPWTLNTHYLASYKAKMTQKYSEVYRSPAVIDPQSPVMASRPASRNSYYPRDVSDYPDAFEEVLSNLRHLGIALSREDLERMQGKRIHTTPLPESSPALEIMAEVRAYFQVAYKRFVDEAPLHIDKNFVRKFSELIEGHLIDGLQLTQDGAHARCANWLSEAPHVIKRREELHAWKHALESAQEKLIRNQLDE
ncbi:hypothetical protein SISNIDRAFT_543513 [Sistotremastrum niveocremeum HHB9708]|uniref:P-loop containing nucleoside triphosphate hydrolase protein n=1 Tax=Sistotremastrum niveocremeum HHB9708 TaxID=1314777 RepID=A0A164WPE9_9AGAM|nr:hypothetical protein SISNIDRAFT_543513 [Sistotremastrum niveocremeum HHB9708]